MHNKVSIIVPVYNAEKYIKQCLESIISQTYENIEIIVVNDGSKDNSLNILKEYVKKSNKMKLVDKKNGGVSSARNAGLKEATGEYITFVDSDDWLEKNAIEIMLRNIKDFDIIQSSYYINADIKFNQKENNTDDINKIKRDILMKNYITDSNTGALRCVWGKLIKREAIKNIKFEESIYLLEDGLFLYECMDNIKKIKFIKENLYHYRKLNDSACNRFNEDQLSQYDNIAKKLKKLLKEDEEYIYNKVMFECLMTYISRVIKYRKFSRKEMIKKIKNICSEEKYQNVITNINKDILNTKEKVTLFFIRNNMFYSLFLICRIKDIIKR